VILILTTVEVGDTNTWIELGVQVQLIIQIHTNFHLHLVSSTVLQSFPMYTLDHHRNRPSTPITTISFLGRRRVHLGDNRNRLITFVWMVTFTFKLHESLRFARYM
jgi:hypothetical protein